MEQKSMKWLTDCLSLSLSLTFAGETNYEGGSHSSLLHLNMQSLVKVYKIFPKGKCVSHFWINRRSVVTKFHFSKQKYEGNTCFNCNLFLVQSKLFHSQIYPWIHLYISTDPGTFTHRSTCHRQCFLPSASWPPRWSPRAPWTLPSIWLRICKDDLFVSLLTTHKLHPHHQDVHDGWGNTQYRHEKSSHPHEVKGSYGYKDKHGKSSVQINPLNTNWPPNHFWQQESIDTWIISPMPMASEPMLGPTSQVSQVWSAIYFNQLTTEQNSQEPLQRIQLQWRWTAIQFPIQSTTATMVTTVITATTTTVTTTPSITRATIMDIIITIIPTTTQLATSFQLLRCLQNFCAKQIPT